MSESLQIGRKCSICTHDSTIEIDKAILKGDSFRDISLRYGMSHASVARHASDCLETDLAVVLREAKQANRIQSIVDVYKEFYEQLEYAKQLRLASKEWLTDPETGRITLEPKADEVQVIYYDPNDTDRNGNPKQNKAKLQFLLDRIEGNRCESPTAIVQTTDLRKFALDALDQTDKAIDKFAKLEGRYTSEKQNPNVIDPHALSFISAQLKQLAKFFSLLKANPKQLQAFADELEQTGAITPQRIAEIAVSQTELPEAHKQAILGLEFEVDDVV